MSEVARNLVEADAHAALGIAEKQSLQARLGQLVGALPALVQFESLTSGLVGHLGLAKPVSSAFEHDPEYHGLIRDSRPAIAL